jgi:hypothetical protein
MQAKESGYHVSNKEWDRIVTDILPCSYVANSHDMLWAIDTDHRVIFANDVYLDFIHHATGEELHVGDLIPSPDGNKESAEKWSYFYTRALGGDSFHVITNFTAQKKSQLIDANFIPLLNSNAVIGTACLARSTSTMVLPTDKNTDGLENNSFHSPS